MFNPRQYGTAQKSALAKSIHPEDLQPNEVAHSRRRQSLPPTITAAATREIRLGPGHATRGKGGMFAYQRGGIRAPRRSGMSSNLSSPSPDAANINRNMNAQSSMRNTYPLPRRPHPLPTKPRFMPMVPLDVQSSLASSSRSEDPHLPKRRRVNNPSSEPLHSRDAEGPKIQQDYFEGCASTSQFQPTTAQRQPSGSASVQRDPAHISAVRPAPYAVPPPPFRGSLPLPPKPPISSAKFDAELLDKPPPPHDKGGYLYPARPHSTDIPRSVSPNLPAADQGLSQGACVPSKRAPSVEEPLEFDKRPPTQPRAHTLRHARLPVHSRYKREPCDTLPPLDTPVPSRSLLVQKPSPRGGLVVFKVKTEDNKLLSPGPTALQIRVERMSVDAHTAIKQELPNPSEVIIPERKLITESCSFYPIPDDCRKSTPGYKENRVSFFQKEYKRLQSFGLRKRRVIFRDDGLAIEWTSPVPVWSDTLLPEEGTQDAT